MSDDVLVVVSKLKNYIRETAGMNTAGNVAPVLSEIVRNTCLVPGAPENTPTFDVTTIPNAKQQRAYDLLETISIDL